MTPFAIVLLVVFAMGLAFGVFALIAPHRRTATPAALAAPAAQPVDAAVARSDWTSEAGDEFANLSEAQRCDFIFAVADLDDDRSHELLVHALDDPSDAVALAAGHALTRRGCFDDVQIYAARASEDRARAILETLTMLE